MKKVSLIGLGAVGSVYGYYLDKNPSIELTILVDKGRKERYEKNPLLLNGEEHIFNYATPDEITEPADLILCVTKYGQFEAAMDTMSTSIGDQTVLLSLLNGISSEEKLAKRFGKDKVIYGVCNGIDATRVGREVSFSCLGTILFGEANNTILSERIQAIEQIFRDSGLTYQIPDDMVQTLWYKFMVNVGVNQITAITGSPYGVIQDCKEAQSLVREAMKEVISLAKAKSIELSEEMIDDWFTRVLPPLTPLGKTSMLQDVEQRRDTEVALFSKKVIELGEELKISTPMNKLLYKMIRTIEFRNHYLYNKE